MSMHIAQLIVLGLLGLGILTMIVPIANVHANVINQGSHLDVGTTAPTCSVTVANAGDIVVMTMQVTQNGESSYSPSDTLSSTNWHIQSFVSLGQHFFWAQTRASGSDTITITLSPNTVNVGSFCYDIDNVPESIISYGSSSGTGTSLAISPAINMIKGSTIISIAYLNSNSAGYVAGTSFIANSGGTLHIDNTEEAASEYANGLGVATNTTCPATQANSVYWQDSCITFAQNVPPPTGPVTTTTTTTTVTNLIDTQTFDTASQLAVIAFIGLIIGVVYKAFKHD